MVDRNELKKLMNNHRQKQDHKAMEPSKTKIFLERKQVRDITNKQETQKKVPKVVKVMNYALLVFHVKFLLQLSVFYKI